MRIEVDLTQTNGIWRDFHQLIIVDIGNRLFQGHFDRRGQAHRFIRAAGPHVRQFLAFKRIHLKIVFAVVLANNHALVDILLAANKEFAAVFKVKDGIGHRDPILHGDQNASSTAWDGTFVRGPGVKYAVQNARAAGVGHEFALIADQAA